MKISARNVFEGKIENVEVGAIMASVKIKIESPELITAIITTESVEKLNLKEGDTVSAIIKSTEIIVSKEWEFFTKFFFTFFSISLNYFLHKIWSLIGLYESSKVLSNLNPTTFMVCVTYQFFVGY